MEAHANALTPTPEYAGEPAWPPVAPRSVQDRRDLSASDRCEIEERAYRPYDPKGLVVVGSAWLAFYVFATIHHLIASGI